MDAKVIGQRIRHMRKERHMRQEDLANELGVRKTTISNYETGYSIPKREVLGRISRFFGVSMDYLCASSDGKDKYLSGVETTHSMEQVPQYEYYPNPSDGVNHPRPRSIRGTVVSSQFAKDCTFSTVVPDDSMNRSRLSKGDEVLVREQNYAAGGDIVLAYVRQSGEVVIRRYYQNGKLISLMPDSTERGYEPLILDAADDPIEILGVISSALIHLN